MPPTSSSTSTAIVLVAGGALVPVPSGPVEGAQPRRRPLQQTGPIGRPATKARSAPYTTQPKAKAKAQAKRQAVISQAARVYTLS